MVVFAIQKRPNYDNLSLRRYLMHELPNGINDQNMERWWSLGDQLERLSSRWGDFVQLADRIELWDNLEFYLNLEEKNWLESRVPIFAMQRVHINRVLRFIDAHPKEAWELREVFAKAPELMQTYALYGHPRVKQEWSSQQIQEQLTINQTLAEQLWQMYNLDARTSQEYEILAKSVWDDHFAIHIGHMYAGNHFYGNKYVSISILSTSSKAKQHYLGFSICLDRTTGLICPDPTRTRGEDPGYLFTKQNGLDESWIVQALLNSSTTSEEYDERLMEHFIINAKGF